MALEQWKTNWFSTGLQVAPAPLAAAQNQHWNSFVGEGATDGLMFLNCVRKLEYVEYWSKRNFTDMRKTCKLHTESSPAGMWTGRTFLLWGRQRCPSDAKRFIIQANAKSKWLLYDKFTKELEIYGHMALNRRWLLRELLIICWCRFFLPAHFVLLINCTPEEFDEKNMWDFSSIQLYVSGTTVIWKEHMCAGDISEEFFCSCEPFGHIEWKTTGDSQMERVYWWLLVATVAAGSLCNTRSGAAVRVASGTSPTLDESEPHESWYLIQFCGDSCCFCGEAAAYETVNQQKSRPQDFTSKSVVSGLYLLPLLLQPWLIVTVFGLCKNV